MAGNDISTVEMGFSDRQLEGIYRTGAYRRMVRSFSDDAVDAHVISRIEDAAKSSRGNDPESMSHYALFHAASVCAAFAAYMIDGEVDTLDIRQWFMLHDALVSANRIACVPDYVVEEGVTVPNLIMSVALICDVMCRCADSEARDKAPLPDLEDATVTKRAFGIYRDILCGRVGFWLSAIDDLACQVAMLMREDFFELRDTYASGRVADYTQGLASAFGLSLEQASMAMTSQAISFSSLFDAHQSDVWDASADTIAVPDEKIRAAVFHPEPLGIFVENAPAGLCDYGPYLRGFCLASGVSAVDSVFFVPRNISSEIESAIAQSE